MSDDGGSPRPPESQMDVEMGNNSCIPGPIAPVSPVPSTNSKSLSYITFNLPTGSSNFAKIF